MRGLEVTFAGASGGTDTGLVRTGAGTVDPRAVRMALDGVKPDGVSWTKDGPLTVWGPTVRDAQLAVAAAWAKFASGETIVQVRFLDADEPATMVTHVSLLRPAGPGEIPPEMRAKADAIMAEQRKTMN